MDTSSRRLSIVMGQHEVAPGRLRFLINIVEEDGRSVRWYVTEHDRVIYCGTSWSRAAALLTADSVSEVAP